MEQQREETVYSDKEIKPKAKVQQDLIIKTSK